MRPVAMRIILSVPILIALGFAEEVRAQSRAWGVGVGVGYGYGYGPYWGRPGFGPYWGVMPNYYNGFYGNGLSMYGPPVPTGKPVPGMFGGGDSQFFGLPPLYPGWMYEICVPINKPDRLPAGVLEPGAIPQPEILPAPALDKPAPLEVEVRLPREDAVLFIDGVEAKGTGITRVLTTPPFATAQAFTYDLRAEWKQDGRTTTHSKRVTGRAGEKVVADFAK